VKLWRVVVAETRTIEMAYTVEAETREEAAELAQKGETSSEDFVRDLAVIDRNILDGPEVEEDE
jgi:hypothetical protein